MSNKIFKSMITVAMAVLAASILIACGFFYNYFYQVQEQQLEEELTLVSSTIGTEGADYFQGYESSRVRFTLIDESGTVLYDSDTDASKMENHMDRKEIKDAFATGQGSDERYSHTLTKKTIYRAIKLEDGTVLRAAVTQITAAVMLVGMIPMILVLIAAAIIISLVLSNRMAKSIVKPLYELDLDHPSSNNDAYEELSPILTKMNKQRKKIKWQKEQLQQKQTEFNQITLSMAEGLVLLDKKGIVISINPAAMKIFGATESPVGQVFLMVDRSPAMSAAIEKALSGKESEFYEKKDGRDYQFLLTGIKSEEKTIGAVILCFDVTETLQAEENRKEFTANVSHELKTPLQSIIGSAELLEAGLVKPEDNAKFVGNIKKEANRMVALINDIIQLSQLDEAAEATKEPVDLYEVAMEVKDALSDSASKRQITLYTEGTSCTMNGIRRYLYEILYNLCDNGIRYNKEGGHVTMSVAKQGNSAVVKVADTGIGIPAEHQSRIFERFYRVDKSHSKETGGTGLGLSIVKHAVAYHDGNIALHSEEGKGTTITVTFPLDAEKQ